MSRYRRQRVYLPRIPWWTLKHESVLNVIGDFKFVTWFKVPVEASQGPMVGPVGPSTSPGPSPGSPLQLTPVLLESQISRLADSARALVKNLPQFEPKPHNTKKKICRDLEVQTIFTFLLLPIISTYLTKGKFFHSFQLISFNLFLKNVMMMSEDDPRRMEEIRKYAAIYGRFDCKRKPEKPLTLHEVSNQYYNMLFKI